MKTSPKPTPSLPGAELDLSKMPGHWLLARMGKRVLRPGGLELTRAMLAALAVGREDKVVELAPGLGTTTRLCLARQPAEYTGIEKDGDAAGSVRRILKGPSQRCLTGTASNTGLDDESATVVYGEAMLTMHTAAQKSAIVREAFRVLAPGGRYGIHELALAPDDLSEEAMSVVRRDLSDVIRVGARPLPISEWRAVLEAEGFDVEFEDSTPMHLLKPRRMINDEGLGGAVRILFNVLRTPAARNRVLAMRRMFRKHQAALCALALVARKPDSATEA